MSIYLELDLGRARRGQSRGRCGCAAVVFMTAVLLSGRVSAQEVGTIAALEGSADILRAGTTVAATIGSAIEQGDEIRTGPNGRTRIVFQDDSVLTVSDNSRVVIDEQVFNADRGTARSALRLLGGKVSAIVSEYYRQRDAAYEIKTVTAVAGVRGTDFVVTHDPTNEVTDVVGISGRIEVRSALDPSAPGVFVTAREMTTVARGQRPAPARRVPDRLFRQYMEGTEFIGGGFAESLAFAHPLLAGASVPKPDRVTSASGAGRAVNSQTVRERRDATGLLKQPPGVFEGNGKLRITFPRR